MERKRGKLISISQEMKDVLEKVDENPDLAIEKMHQDLQAVKKACFQAQEMAKELAARIQETPAAKPALQVHRCNFDISMVQEAVENALVKMRDGKL